MAKITEFTVCKAALVSLGQNSYENVRLEASLTVTLDEGDDLDKERNKAMSNINDYLRDEIDAVELKERRASSKAKRFGI